MRAAAREGFNRNDLLRPYSSQSASRPIPPRSASHGQICGVEPARAVGARNALTNTYRGLPGGVA